MKMYNIVRKKSSGLLRDRMRAIVPGKVQEYKDVKKTYGDKKIGEITVDQVMGGMRGMHGLFYETSKLDAQKGIMYRQHNLFDLCETLKYKGSKEPLPEALIWYLFTGEIPNEAQIESTIKEINDRSSLSKETEALIRSLPKDMHPMTQLSIGVMSMQRTSHFAKAYREGVSKGKYWEPYFEDSMDLIAKLPRLASLIYNCTYKNGQVPDINTNHHMTKNFANMLGLPEEGFENILSHYLVLHADHEGGNVSAHTVHLVGSALSDPYLSFSAGLNGLAGPLHGLANQEVLRWLLDCQQAIGLNPSDADLEKYVRGTLASGKVVPGYGHAVLREVDPRYAIQVQIGDKYLSNNELFKLVKQCFKVIPKILGETGKVKNPWPNVDCSSGVLLYYYGLREFDMYTVLFGVSRAIGTLSMLTWSRAYGLAIERPGSITLDWIKNNVKL
jgi:citrate synthase